MTRAFEDQSPDGTFGNQLSARNKAAGRRASIARQAIGFAKSAERGRAAPGPGDWVGTVLRFEVMRNWRG